MNADLVFTICNTAVLPFWLLLAAAPRWEWTQRLVHGVWVFIALAVVYIAAFALAPEAPEGAGFGSLKGVMLFFTVPEAALAGWVHYLAFDLFIGAWEVRDAQRREIRHVFVIPCLALTLMLGPVGLLAYLTLRAALGGGAALAEAE